MASPGIFLEISRLREIEEFGEWKDWLSTRTEYSVTPILTKNEAIPRIVEEKPNLLSYVDSKMSAGFYKLISRIVFLAFQRLLANLKKRRV